MLAVATSPTEFEQRPGEQEQRQCTSSSGKRVCMIQWYQREQAQAPLLGRRFSDLSVTGDLGDWGLT